MNCSSKDLRKRLEKIWPNLKHVWLTDRMYYLPTYEEVRKVVANQNTKKYKWKTNVLECEEFSLFLHSDLKKETSNNELYKYTWAFGEAIGLNFDNGEKGPHKLNICITDNNIYLIEPQTFQIWKVMDLSKKDTDSNFIFYITM